jgi:glyoxylase-like metal-dependent hydrolase (beta-lactamase superfamily II)
MYLLFGKNKTLLVDTGATKDAAAFPLYDTVQSLLREFGGAEDRELVVVHSHHHTDHYAGDSQFAGQPNVTLVEPTGAAMFEFFALEQWPNNEAHLDLGDRRLTIIPSPGHQEEAISIYDPQTKWLLTGDTIYPGHVHVKDWDEYTLSIARLSEFVQTHEVSAVLGGHIEMTNTPGETYQVGITYQPEEASLVVAPASIVALHAALEQSATPSKLILDELVVAPMGVLQKTVSRVVRWFTQ